MFLDCFFDHVQLPPKKQMTSALLTRLTSARFFLFNQLFGIPAEAVRRKFSV